MEIYGYTSIAISPLLLFLFSFILTFFICKRKGKASDLANIMVFNVFPDILKSKKDERNQPLVYFRKEKVLLQGKTLFRVYRALFAISFSILCYVVFVFGQIAFIEYSYDCQDIEQEGKDCFKYPPTTSFNAERANCSDPDVLSGKTPIICYTLVFQFELAVGISYGLYKVCTVLLSIGSTLIIKINKNHVKRLKIVVGIITLIIVITVVVLAIIFQSHPFLRYSASKLKIFFTATFGLATAVLFIALMPWEEIVELKERANTDEELGRDNPVS